MTQRMTRKSETISTCLINAFHRKSGTVAKAGTQRLLDQRVYCALSCLGRLSECAEERTPHPLAISKTVLPKGRMRAVVLRSRLQPVDATPSSQLIRRHFPHGELCRRQPGILVLLPVTPLLRRGDADVAVFSSLGLEAEIEPALGVVLVPSDPPARLRMRQNRTCDGKWLPAPSVTVLWRSFYFQVV